MECAYCKYGRNISDDHYCTKCLEGKPMHTATVKNVYVDDQGSHLECHVDYYIEFEVRNWGIKSLFVEIVDVCLDGVSKSPQCLIYPPDFDENGQLIFDSVTIDTVDKKITFNF